MICFALAHLPLLKLAPQGAQRQTLSPAKLLRSQSAGFDFAHQRLYLLAVSPFVLQRLSFPSSQQLSRNASPLTGGDAHTLTINYSPVSVSASLAGRHDDNPCNGKVTVPLRDGCHQIVDFDRNSRGARIAAPRPAVRPSKHLPRTNASLPVALKRYPSPLLHLSETLSALRMLANYFESENNISRFLCD